MLFRGGLAREQKIYSPNVSYCFLYGRRENKRRLSFQRRGYLFFDQAIDLLDNSKNEDYETMLSLFLWSEDGLSDC